MSRRWEAALGATLALVIACGGGVREAPARHLYDGGADDAGASPDVSAPLAKRFQLTIVPASVDVVQRKPPTSIAIHVDRVDDYAGSISVGFSALSAGLTGSSTLLGPGVNDGEVTLTASDDATQGIAANVYLFGTAADALEQDAPLGLTVVGCHGCVDQSFGKRGLVDLPAGITRITSMQVDASDRIVFTGSGDALCVLGRTTKDGELDPSFGTQGIVTLAAGQDCNGAKAFAGAGVLVLSVLNANAAAPTSKLQRFEDDGSLDTTFGASGAFTQVLPWGALEWLNVGALGELTLSGISNAVDDIYQGETVRLLPNGMLDAAFGTGGRLHVTWSGYAYLNHLANAPGSRFLALGMTNTLPDGPSQVILASYFGSGAVDTAFGANGLATTSYLHGAQSLYAADAVVAKSGKVWMAGVIEPTRAVVGRFFANGTVDDSLDVNRLKVLPDLGAASSSTLAVAENPAGDLVLFGSSTPLKSGDPAPLLVWRIHPDGSLDAEFGAGGASAIVFQSQNYLVAGALQSAGAMVVAGDTYDPGGSNVAPVLARILK